MRAKTWLAILIGVVPLIGGCGLVPYAARGNQPDTVKTAPTVARTVRTTSSAGPWWTPDVGATFLIQYTGKVDFSRPFDVYNLDWERTNASDVTQLRDRGVASVCYLNAGAYEDFRPDKDSFPASVIGNDLDGWPGEKWLDVRQISTLLPIMTARMDVCKSKGFVAIDPDNTDGWTQDTGFPISAADQIAYQRALAAAAHERGLAVGLKNNEDQIDDLAKDVDFAVNEECVAYRECDQYQAFLAGGKAVFNIEYKGSPTSVCPGRPAGMSTVISNRKLSGTITACP